MDRSLRAWILFVALAVLAGGCGVDSPDLIAVPRVTSLLRERTFTQGDLEITEQVTTTNVAVGTDYHLRATVLNLGADLPAARFEMLLQDEFVRENGTRPATLTTGEIEVGDFEELGTLHSGQTKAVALQARVLGGRRVRVSGRVASGS